MYSLISYFFAFPNRKKNSKRGWKMRKCSVATFFNSFNARGERKKWKEVNLVHLSMPCFYVCMSFSVQAAVGWKFALKNLKLKISANFTQLLNYIFMTFERKNNYEYFCYSSRETEWQAALCEYVNILKIHFHQTLWHCNEVLLIFFTFGHHVCSKNPSLIFYVEWVREREKS